MTQPETVAGVQPVRILVAGVGNIFLSDDGFGPEVARRLSSAALPPGVRVVDYGIRGMHLAYDLLDGYDALVLLDLVPPCGEPGRISAMEIGADQLGNGEFDAHGMNPAAMLGNLEKLGGSLPRTVVIGCEPASIEEGIGLSAQVAASVDRAVDEAVALVGALHTELSPGGDT
ncbi:MAG: hydrogenase maturation protease [Jatrophihabitans sp.]